MLNFRSDFAAAPAGDDAEDVGDGAVGAGVDGELVDDADAGEALVSEAGGTDDPCANENPDKNPNAATAHPQKYIPRFARGLPTKTTPITPLNKRKTRSNFWQYFSTRL